MLKECLDDLANRLKQAAEEALAATAEELMLVGENGAEEDVPAELYACTRALQRMRAVHLLTPRAARNPIVTAVTQQLLRTLLIQRLLPAQVCPPYWSLRVIVYRPRCQSLAGADRAAARLFG